MHIKLSEIMSIENRQKYKVHLASFNGKEHPLDVFVKSPKDWDDWNAWRMKQDDFNRQYIFSLIQFFHEPDIWLFGGIYEVTYRGKENNSLSYKVKLLENSRNLVGRLKVRLRRPGRARAVSLERYFDQIAVFEILREVYTGKEFCGFENINHDFQFLENVFKTNKPDWKSALENVKGVYLITDKSNGKRYVGSAYGDTGIWSRWSSYIETGHGSNEGLTKLIREQGIEYARKNFTFVLLEYRSMKADDKVIIERENYWKEVLLTRSNFGYNKN